MKGLSSQTVGMSQRSSTQNRLTDYNNARPSIIMNNFAGPSDTDNFPSQEVQAQYAAGESNNSMVEDPNTPFMGNHIVKTVRNLRMR